MRFKNILFLPFLFTFFPIFGQEKISGRIIGEDLVIPMEIKIFDKDTTLLAKTDYDGYFNLELPKSSNQLILAGLGYEWTKITVSENCTNLEILILSEYIYDFMTLRKIDRLRKKRFDKIPDLRTQAFNKGLFNTKTPCFEQEFESLNP